MQDRHSFSRVSIHHMRNEHSFICVHTNQTLIHPQSLIQPLASPPLLLTLQPKPNLVALARSLTLRLKDTYELVFTSVAK